MRGLTFIERAILENQCSLEETMNCVDDEPASWSEARAVLTKQGRLLRAEFLIRYEDGSFEPVEAWTITPRGRDALRFCPKTP